MAETSWRDRLFGGFRRTSDKLGENIAGIFSKAALDEQTLDELEEALITTDLGPAMAARIRDRLAEGKFNKELTEEYLREILAEEIEKVLTPVAKPIEIAAFPRPQVILVIGVNGSGKTTTIAKLARLLQSQHYSVMLAAGDTFRAAAIDQLKIWADRARVPIIASQPGSDPGAVVYDALQAAQARNIDVLIIDTAGRLHTKFNLMEELKKIRRVLAKLDPTAPHEVLLVLDATTGQNAVLQAREFTNAVDVTGLVLTKIDGTAKGGVIFAIGREFKTPIKFLGDGEQIEDIDPFEPRPFVEALLRPGQQTEPA